MSHILFVCTANLYRSPLAAALFVHRLQVERQSQSWMVESAGTWATSGQRLPADIVGVARAMGIDLTAHVTRRLDRDLLRRFDLVLVMERGHQEALRVEFPFARKKVHLLSRVADGLDYDVPDPANSDLRLSEIAAQVARLIERAYPAICELAQDREIL